MRAALWFTALFVVAVASALFAGNNQGTVTVFWAPYRVDLSLNLVLLLLVAAFVLVHGALRALTALFSIPRQARRWRQLQRERAIHASLLDALSHLAAGRYVRARKAAELVLSLEQALAEREDALTNAGQLRTLAHLLAAEAAQALRDRTLREQHFRQALEQSLQREALDVRDGVQLRAAAWALEDRDASAALGWLEQLPVGASRRTLALRLYFRASRLAGQTRQALETARLLTKHRAFTELAGRSIARGLALEWLRNAHDPVQLQRVWDALDVTEQRMPDVALQAAERLLLLEGSVAQSRHWLLPVWDSLLQDAQSLTLAQRVRLVQVLERGFRAPDGEPDIAWLTRIEAAQVAQPRETVLQYLAGSVCLRLGLWGKAQQMLKQSLTALQDDELRRDAWLALARLAEERQDSEGAAQAYVQAAKR